MIALVFHLEHVGRSIVRQKLEVVGTTSLLLGKRLGRDGAHPLAFVLVDETVSIATHRLLLIDKQLLMLLVVERRSCLPAGMRMGHGVGSEVGVLMHQDPVLLKELHLLLQLLLVLDFEVASCISHLALVVPIIEGSF